MLTSVAKIWNPLALQRIFESSIDNRFNERKK